MGKRVLIVPKCGNCGTNIYELCVERSNFEIAPSLTIQIIKHIAPSACPMCNVIFNRVEIDTDNETIIVRER